MNSNVRKYHKEFSPIIQIVKDEENARWVRSFSIRAIIALYISIVFTSLFLFDVLVVLLIISFQLVTMPFFFHQVPLVKSPFLAVDDKYVQYSGSMMAWHSITKIKIENLPFKKHETNYRVEIYQKNKQSVIINTYYFKDQEDIINSFISLSNKKCIPIIYFAKRKNRN